METNRSVDVLIVGGGPIGIACGLEARRAGLSHLVIEKGCLTNAIYQFPAHLVFFSTANLLEIGDVPFVASGSKPTRTDCLFYYRRVAEHHRLDIHLYERVLDVARNGKDLFTVRSDKGVYGARYVVLAIGFYDFPNLLGVPGEDLSKVSHYYREPHAFYRQKVAVIGGQNSAAEAALELFRSGAEVTLIHRRDQLGATIKYWVRPDIDNRIREGSIRAFFNARVKRIDEKTITFVRGDGESETIDNDFVLAMTGYHPDLDFLERLGVQLETETRKPVHDPATMETNIERIYIAGVAAGGRDANKIFIENGREHAKLIARHIAGRLAPGRKD